MLANNSPHSHAVYLWCMTVADKRGRTRAQLNADRRAALVARAHELHAKGVRFADVVPTLSAEFFVTEVTVLRWLAKPQTAAKND